MSELITAIGLVLVLEGVLYALLPGGMKSVMRSALETPDQTLRTAGLVAAAIGVFLVWIVRG
ncbi:MAG: DUF2065 domain-containing protein [Roseibium sp.]|uniref:DUF2065 domain-containing protein n=1 Tax=Roseibium sp. TaxID=1936156 RepID=UPI001B2221E7|nr:DUF2065 domain-containing protein [Roseibium sp.]MBO6508114.1 DUF2065 domain-containing protein [Roseibium sp.]MBO6893498.1 DUF2065 domain-containing protein [Roseibium sp.]MBO6931759.1 DUF2065 domain-containing protein [Roseibium sp.]